MEIDREPDGWVIAPQDATLVELMNVGPKGEDMEWQMPVFDTLRQARAWLSEWWVTNGEGAAS